MKPSELLKQKGWCQGAYARNIYGQHTNINSPDATNFCITGAVKFCYEDSNPTKMYQIFNNLIAYTPLTPTSWNDYEFRTKEEVIALLESIGE